MSTPILISENLLQRLTTLRGDEELELVFSGTTEALGLGDWTKAVRQGEVEKAERLYKNANNVAEALSGELRTHLAKMKNIDIIETGHGFGGILVRATANQWRELLSQPTPGPLEGKIGIWPTMIPIDNDGLF